MSHVLAPMPRDEFLKELANLNTLLDTAEVTVGFQVEIQRLLRASGVDVSLLYALRMRGVTRVRLEVPCGEDPDEYCAALEAHCDGLLGADPAPEQWSTSAVLDARKAALDSLRGLRSR